MFTLEAFVFTLDVFTPGMFTLDVFTLGVFTPDAFRVRVTKRNGDSTTQGATRGPSSVNQTLTYVGCPRILRCATTSRLLARSRPATENLWTALLLGCAVLLLTNNCLILRVEISRFSHTSALGRRRLRRYSCWAGPVRCDGGPSRDHPPITGSRWKFEE